MYVFSFPMSLSRAFQWVGVAAVLLVLVGLNYEFESKAGMQMNAAPESPLSQSLRGYWKLDDGSGTNATDASGNANTLAMTGSPSWVAGQIGPYSLDFSGTGQYLSVASPASGVLDFADGASFSITGWFNRDTFTADHTIVAKRNGQTATDDGYIVYIDDATDTLVFEASDTADTDEYQRVSTSAFTATGWHQFAVTWNDSATTDPVNIFIDGALNNGTATGTFASMGDLTESVAFRIGAESDAGNPFDGKLDDIRIYGYALSADQVKKVYNTTSPTQPIDTSLVGHWTFDGPDIQGTTAIDRSSFGNNGTITGATKTIGKLGQALSFNFSSGKVTTSQALSTLISSSTTTFSAWVKPGNNYDASGAPYSLAPIISASDNYIGIYRGQYAGIGRDAIYAFNYDGNSDVTLIDAGSVPVGQWVHVVLVHSGGNLYGYLNGLLTSSTASGNTQSLSGTASIGGTDGGYFDGLIDDVRVYSRALSTTEIENLYRTGK